MTYFRLQLGCCFACMKTTRHPGFGLFLLVPVICLAALSGGGEPHTAHAQGADHDYVDVGLTLVVPEEGGPTRSVTVFVFNQGSRTAYDVEVVVDITYPEDTSYFESAPDVPIGSAYLGAGGYSFHWTIPALRGLQGASVAPKIIYVTFSDPVFDMFETPHEYNGKVSTSSFESARHQGNNTDRGWSVTTSSSDNKEPARPNYSVDVSVDEQDPSPGDFVNFTVTAGNSGRFAVIDQEVAIELTDGLAVDEDAAADPPRAISYDPDTRPASVNYSNGVFNIGTLTYSDLLGNLTHSVTLPVRVSSNAPVNEQCLTATITGNPPPGPGPREDDISDNVAKLCLGESPHEKVIFSDGTADLWALYPCVGVTTLPCDTSDSVVLAVNGASAAANAGAPYPVFEPEDIVVHIPDHQGRNLSDGNIWWNNGHDADNSEFGSGIFPGVVSKFDRSLIETDHYSQLRASLVANTPGEGSDKGHVSVVFASSYAIKFFDTEEPRLSYGPNDFSSIPPLFFRFTKLGTYSLAFTMGVLYDSDPGDGTPPVDPDDLYSDTATYTFHVGPMAELEVKEGDASPDVASDRVAFTLLAANNGPNDPLDAEVTIDLSSLPSGVTVTDHITSDGTYSAGKWDLGVLNTSDHRGSQGKPQQASLTLILAGDDAASATATATIANVTNYTVCIGSDASTLAHTTQADCEADTTNGGSWYEGTVYDYDDSNNTATVTAQAGTGGGGEGAPTLQTPSVHTPSVGISWSEVDLIHGVPVKDYQVQWSSNGADGWTQLDTDLPFNELFDITIQSGHTRFYRVRAVNEAGVPGPWSAPVIARTAGAEAVPSAPTNVSAVADGASAIDVSWSAPLDDGGAPVTRYEVQWSADGVSGWRSAGSTADGDTFTLKNTGMTFGTTRYYRVAARNSRGLSDWSDPPASATTLAGVPGRPVLTARATDTSTIALSWTVPPDNGDPITGYEIQWSADGSANSWNTLASPGVSDTSYDDTGLHPGTRRYYQIRAVNGTGDGSWSSPANATTPAAAPGAPTLRAAANGENAIDLSWDPPADDGGASISQYELHVSIDGSQGSYSRLTSPSASARSYTHGGLKPGDGRHYQIRARNSAGWGEFSQAASATTLTGVPTAPGLTVRANGATEIKLTWTKPDDRGSDILRYEIEQSDDGNDWGILSPGIRASDSEYVHTGLSAGTTKHYRVRAVNANGEGQWSTIRSARTDAGGPDAPVLTLSVDGETRIDLSWTVPADNGSSIRGYWVERSRDGGAPWERLTSGNRTTNYSDTDLYRGMTRYYRVAAYNGVGTSAFSEVKSATTTGVPATAPSAPTLVRVSDIARGQVTVQWAAPENDGGAPISGYEYHYSLRTPCADNPDRICSTEGDTKTTTSTSARITGLTTAGLYSFSVRAVNPIGKGDLAAAQMSLAPSSNAAVRVSATSITVDEGESFTYTVRLATEPPHPVLVLTRSRTNEDHFSDYATAHVLSPDNWTHPDPNRNWPDGITSEWDQGVTVTRTANEDGDALDGAAVIDISVEQPGYDFYRPCDHRPQGEQVECKQDWEDDWDGSPYVKLSGPSVLVTIRDDD